MVLLAALAVMMVMMRLLAAVVSVGHLGVMVMVVLLAALAVMMVVVDLLAAVVSVIVGHTLAPSVGSGGKGWTGGLLPRFDTGLFRWVSLNKSP